MRRLILMFSLLLLAVVSQVSAVSVGSIGAASTSCDPLTIDMGVVGVHTGDPNIDDIGYVDLYDGDGTHVYHDQFTLPAGSNVTALNFSASQFISVPQANPMRLVVTDVDTGVIAWDYSFTATCVSRTVDNPGIAYASDGIKINVIQEEDERYGVEWYGVELDGETGFVVLSLTAGELEELEPGEENTLIAEGEQTTYWGNVSLYLLTTGEIQINVGPDEEGKVRVTIYDAIPPTRVYRYDFDIDEILEGE